MSCSSLTASIFENCLGALCSVYTYALKPFGNRKIALMPRFLEQSQGKTYLAPFMP